MQLCLIHYISSKTTLKKKVYISSGASNMAQTYSFQSLLAHLENKEQIILGDFFLGEKKRDEKLF